jgi:hypothetical protein
MMLIDLAFFPKHVAGIPFAAESRDGIDTPVEINAKLGVTEPLGSFVVFVEGRPVGIKFLRSFV